jgi:very-short-patch-repair endonuclease
VKKVYNHPSGRNRRIYLRRTSTFAERLLWNELRGRRLNGLKFRRQYGIENYVVDFYCSDYNLAIELDGEVHTFEENIERDKLREINLILMGIKILRFTNKEVTDNMKAVLKKIIEFTRKA